ncbi:hypothetical protein EDB95_4900 [Dinghuibacter silviterrae]|uniref:Uncharacterized protein n=1 Tax=Dinghuibacter silviterrae TaxID=1539049 RepID=A0A4V3GKU9_9BACT|nr:hypothetical protein EDB95_4900 [Dinghuibacter silviterrae]
MATVHNKYSRLHEERQNPSDYERRKFLWCYKCTQEESDIVQSNVSIELLHILSGRGTALEK